jgi:hypothetical protein
MTDTLHTTPRPTTNRVPSTLALAIREAQLLLRQPVFLLGVLLTVLYGSQNDYDGLSGPALAVTMFLGVPAYFAANLRVTHARRVHTDELLDTCPTSLQQRTLALCLGALGPFLVAWALAIGLDTAYGHRYDRLAEPGMLRLLVGPLSVLGGALLGIMIGRLLPIPGAALITMVGIVTACVYLQNGTNTLFSPYTSWGGWQTAAYVFDPERPGSRPGTSSTSHPCASWPHAEPWPHTPNGAAQPTASAL